MSYRIYILFLILVLNHQISAQRPKLKKGKSNKQSFTVGDIEGEKNKIQQTQSNTIDVFRHDGGTITQLDQSIQIGDIKGNNNEIKIVQKNTVNIYNLLDPEASKAFIKNVGSMPNLNPELRKLIKTNNRMVIQIALQTRKDGTFDPYAFNDKFEEHIRDMKRLIEEVQSLRKNDPRYSKYNKALSEAKKRFEAYSIEIANNILLDYEQEENEKNYKEIANSAYLRASSYYINHEYDAALGAINKSISIVNDDFRYLVKKAEILSMMNRSNESIAYYLRALNDTAIKDSSKSYIYNSVGIIYSELSDFDKSNDYYMKALRAKDKNASIDYIQSGKFYNNVGVNFLLKKKPIPAMQNFRLAIENYSKIKTTPKTYIAQVYNNIGLIYRQMAKYDSALVYVQKALLIDEINYQKGHPFLAEYEYNLALIYYDKKMIDEAILRFKKVLNTIEVYKLGSEDRLIRTIVSLAKIYCEDKADRANFLMYYVRAIEIEKSYNINSKNIETYLKDCYKKFK